jgi:hypothetical protein
LLRLLLLLLELELVKFAISSIVCHGGCSETEWLRRDGESVRVVAVRCRLVVIMKMMMEEGRKPELSGKDPCGKLNGS